MKSSDDLVLERPKSSATEIAERAGNTIKSVLFHVHEDDGLDARLQSALSLARASSAHIQLLQIVPIEAYTVVDTYGGTFVSGQIVEALQEEAQKVRARLEDHLRKEDVSWSYDATTSAVFPELLKNTALSDIVFIGRQPRTREFGRTGPTLLGQLVSSARTLLCVPGEATGSLDPFGKAVIAWNGSFEAANAVRASLGLLKFASHVRIVRFSEDKETAFPDTRLLQYLSRHEIHAELDSRTVRRSFSADLVEYASVHNASYIVMGGYSHSRAGEFLFGGVTRDLLGECPITLALAH